LRDFDGSNQYLTLAGLSVGGADFSVAATIICDTASVGRSLLSSAGATTWFFQIGGAGLPLSFFTATTAGTFPTGTIARVVGTYTHSTTTCRLYVNGVLDGSSSAAAITSASGIDIGRRGDGIYWDGAISEVGIWSTVLTAADARAYAAGYAPSMIKPASLLTELHLLNNDGDRDSWGNYAVTATNSPGYRSNHPRAIYSRRAQLVTAAGSPPPAPSIAPLAMAHYRRRRSA